MTKKICLLGCLLAMMTAVHAQSSYKRYSYLNGFCGGSMMLYADGRYIRESGCEASSRFTWGTFTRKKDTLHFTSQDIRKIPVIREVIATRVPGDSVSFTVLDKNGINVTGVIQAALWLPKIGVVYPFSRFTTENAQVKKMKKIEGSFLTLTTLNFMFGRNFDYPADSTNHFVIKLHIPEEQLFRSRWNSAPEEFSMVLRGDTLRETIVHPEMAKYVLEKN